MMGGERYPRPSLYPSHHQLMSLKLVNIIVEATRRWTTAGSTTGRWRASTVHRLSPLGDVREAIANRAAVHHRAESSEREVMSSCAAPGGDGDGGGVGRESLGVL